jgi:hypothetical protein
MRRRRSMKEITRRLYTKPVMLGIALLVGAGLLVGLFVTSQRTSASIYIQAGNDEFETTGDGQTYHNFQASKIKADFFGPGSNEFTSIVPLVGVPLNPAVSDVDTIIQRNQDVYLPESPTTTLQMTGFSLKSINPITVTYSNGTPSESWNVTVGLSVYKTSTGSMTLNAGGTFDSTLKVWPRFTFKRIPDNKTLVLDTGAPTGPGLTAVESPTTMSNATAVVIEPRPAPCPVIAEPFEPQSKATGSSFSTATATSSSCAPVTLTSTNSPWQFCNGVFCIPRPITEAELLASHFASPKGTKKQQQAAGE